jgi:hypothetical protein
MTQVYRNTRCSFKKGMHIDATQAVACEPVDDEAPIPSGYVPADSSILDDLEPLYIRGGVRFYGYS